YIWDGRRWKRDLTNEVEQLAKGVVRSVYREAGDAPDPNLRAALGTHAIKSEAESRIHAMISLARSEPNVPVVPDQLDTNGWLFNVVNGTIDLRSGQLRDHRREDRITKLAPVTYDPDARLELWDRHLANITRGDKELAQFHQRVAGYALTGDTGEEKLFL